MLQGTTPLMIVLGSALVPGERLRWWHVAGATFGLVGVLMLIEGGEAAGSWPDAAFYLNLIGIAAALWGVYAIFARSQPDVPTSALGVCYAASAAICLAAHGVLESWVTPTGSEWAAIAGLGILPMGLAIDFWDFGIKRGDIQALGAFAYVEPFIGAVLVALFAHGYRVFAAPAGRSRGGWRCVGQRQPLEGRGAGRGRTRSPAGIAADRDAVCSRPAYQEAWNGNRANPNSAAAVLPEERQRQLGLAGSEEPDEPNHLAGANDKRDLGEFAGAGCLPDLERGRDANAPLAYGSASGRDG